METKRCPHCGETLPRSSTFCPACFKEITDETVTPVIVSRKRPILFLWFGICAIVVLFFIFMSVFSRAQKTNMSPATFTQSPQSDNTASVTSTTTANTVSPSLPLQIPTLSTFTTRGGTTASPTTSVSITPIKTVATATSTTSSTPTKGITATVPSTTITKTPTQTKATVTTPKASSTTATPTTTVKPTSTVIPTVTDVPTATVKPTATQTVKPTQAPAINESLFVYTISDGKTTITKYNGSDAVVYIPETLGGYPVTKIGDEAFSTLQTLLEVYFSDEITEIGTGAFSFCYNLQKVYLPESLKKIGENAFYCCVNLSSISLPDTLEYMGPGSFTESGLDEIKIPASVTQMDSALYSMHYLDYIEVEKGNPVYFSQDGVLFQRIDDGTYMLLKYPAEKADRSYTIPDNTSIIAVEAFRENQSLVTITFSKQLTTIYSNAFFMCSSITTVKTYANLQTVFSGAFYRCTNLANINFEPSVTYIGDDVFAYCDNPTLTVRKGSYAHTYAEENDIPYVLK